SRRLPGTRVAAVRMTRRISSAPRRRQRVRAPTNAPQGCHVRGYEFGPFRLDVSARELINNGAPIELTSKTFDLLLTLIRHRDRLVPKQELISTVWPDAYVSEG